MSQDSRAVEVCQSSQDGFRVVGLRSPELELGVVPELGAKIITLRHRRTGRQWLWSAVPTPRLFRNRPGDGFEQSPLLGIDECLPTIAARREEGLALPDHGEVWAVPWELDEAALGSGCIASAVTLQCLPLRFCREIDLSGGRVRLRYLLCNLANRPLRYLWAFHPVFRLEAGDRLELPADLDRCWVEQLQGPPRPAKGTTLSWPLPLPELNLPEGSFGPYENGSAKLFFRMGSEAWAAIRAERSGERLLLRFSSQQIPYLGFWITRGGWQGHHQWALEPTNYPADALRPGLDEQLGVAASELAAGETRRWALSLELQCRDR